MIAQTTVDEILHLLDAGSLSQRKIARRLGVSRGTVNALAQGKRPAHLGRTDFEDFAPPIGPPRRCPGCGGLVLMPCLLCHVRARKSTAGPRPD
jgi:Helix-turn-helix domain